MEDELNKAEIEEENLMKALMPITAMDPDPRAIEYMKADQDGIRIHDERLVLRADEVGPRMALQDDSEQLSGMD